MIKFTKITKALEEIAETCKKNKSIEACGFLGFDYVDKKYVVQHEKNCSINPKEEFRINSFNFLMFKKNFSIAAIFHSHILGSFLTSDFDEMSSENCCVPFLIYSLNEDKFDIYQPKNIEYDVSIFKKIKENI
jgi:proteasome lid subunit RPN8/RPN11